MDRTAFVSGLTAALLLCGCSNPPAGRAIRVGSKNFTEQVVLGEIIAQHLEHRLHRPVERRLNLGGTLLAHRALLEREIDLYPEYTGTALAAILKQPSGHRPETVLTKAANHRFRVVAGQLTLRGVVAAAFRTENEETVKPGPVVHRKSVSASGVRRHAGKRLRLRSRAQGKMLRVVGHHTPPELQRGRVYM